MKGHTLIAGTITGLAALLVLLTRRDFSKPQIRIFTEMADSPAYRSQERNPVFADGRTLRAPVPGTIPRGHGRFGYGPGDDERARAGAAARNPLEPGFQVLERGRTIYANFCSHCHGRSGRGDGPVAAVVPAFAMSVVGESTATIEDGAIVHIITHGRNNMPAHGSQVRLEDRWKLLSYLRDLQHRESARLARLGVVHEPDPRVDTLVTADYGAEIYRTNCTSCHGEEGRQPVRGVPTLNVARVLAVAEDDYYRSIITHGRKGTQMPAWGKILTPTQIQSLVLYIRSWSAPEPDRSVISAWGGDVARGRALFRGNCAACHGPNGEGGIGVSLRAPSFLAMVSDEFLRDTITRGRSHTAMPSGYAFSPDEISDLMAWIRSWERAEHALADVTALLPEANPRIGKKLYEARCGACHGKNGEGDIGTRLDSDSFLAMADDAFLYRAIRDGRPGTAMPAWHFLSAEDVADIIAHLRTWQRSPSRVLSTAPRYGRAEFGELLYRQACAACHGPEGRGGVGTQLANRVFLDSASDEFLWRTIAHGKEGTAMRGFLDRGSSGALMPLTSTDIDHIVAYLRSLQDRPRVDPPMRPHSSRSLTIGKQIYEETAACAKCHGLEGEGGTGPALGNPDFLAVASDGYLIGTLVLGREGTAMPSFYRGGNVMLTQDEVESVVAWVRNFRNHPPTAPRRLESTATAVAEGRELYLSHCAACHGTEGRGPSQNRIDGYAPSLNNQEFLEAADDGFLLATIALGRPGTPMKPFARGAGGISDLSADEIKRIVVYIRSWEETP